MMDVLQWPAGAPTCAQSWQRQGQPVTIRSELEDGAAKVRRRFTAPVFLVSVGMMVTLAQARLIEDFFYIDCGGGVRPFSFFDPIAGELRAFRMVEAPTIAALDQVAASVSMRWESLPYWG